MHLKTLIQVGAAALLLALCASAPAKDSGFAYASLHASCAPWDGPAVVVTLTQEHSACTRAVFPQLGIYIWRGLPIHAPTTIKFDSQSGNGGASLCTSEGECKRATSGSITFDQYEEGKRGAGHYEFTFADGSTQQGSFDAPWCNERVVCG